MTKNTPAPPTVTAKGLNVFSTFFRKDTGAVDKEPVMWYFPSVPLVVSDGRPFSFVPMYALFKSRSRTTVSLSHRFSSLSWVEILAIPCSEGLKPGTASETVSEGR